MPPLQIESTEIGRCTAPLFHCEVQFIRNWLVVRTYFFTNMTPCMVYYNRQVYKYRHMTTSRGNGLYPATVVTQCHCSTEKAATSHILVVVTAHNGCGTLYLAIKKPTQLMPAHLCGCRGPIPGVELVWHSTSVSTLRVWLLLLQKYAKNQL